MHFFFPAHPVERAECGRIQCPTLPRLRFPLPLMLTLSTAGLDEGLHSVALTPEADQLDLDADAFRQIEVEARVDVHPRRVLVMLDARAVASLICDRTLDPFQQQIEGTHTVLFSDEAGAEDPEHYDDIRPLPPGDRLDITDAVRDTLLLALPLRRVSPRAEALELTLQYGADLKGDDDPVDPRWEKLRALREKDEG